MSTEKQSAEDDRPADCGCGHRECPVLHSGDGCPLPSADYDARTAPQFLFGKRPGVNLDPIDVGAGLARLQVLGWDPDADARTFTVIQYALQRWARGEEQQAEDMAIAKGDAWADAESKSAAIDLTSWRVVLASAMAGATRDTPPATTETTPTPAAPSRRAEVNGEGK